jgi:hypothetical protein
LAYISKSWRSNPDLEAIRIGLEDEDHFEETFRELLYLNTPILQEPPEGLDETWRHGVLLIGGHGQERFELARNYRYVAEKMLEQALANNEARTWLCPVLFAYRHTLELYLKTIGEINKRSHSLTKCAESVEKHHGSKINPRIKCWIVEFDKIDPHPGTAFRYEEGENPHSFAEYWVDLNQFKCAMNKVFEMLDSSIIRTGTKGSPPQKGKSKSSAI